MSPHEQDFRDYNDQHVGGSTTHVDDDVDDDDDDGVSYLEEEQQAAAITQQHRDITSEDVILRIEQVVSILIEDFDNDVLPMIETLFVPNGPPVANKPLIKRFSLNQCRSFTSIIMVLSYCHSLLRSHRTTTTREVYYFFVTHFRSQRECDAAIAEAADLLQVSRHALGLKASPRGWFCGDIQLISKQEEVQEQEQDEDGAAGQERQVILDGRTTHQSTGHSGSPISSDWLLPCHLRSFDIATVQASCVLVIEKEGVYNRLSEDLFYQNYPCVLVTGKGFPDLATRAMVHALHHELGLPVLGLADCDPFGVMVLHTYQYSERAGVDGGGQYGVPIQWMGLRPSQVKDMKTLDPALPEAVFLKLTELDRKRLECHLLKENHRWTDNSQNERRVEELQDMLESGYKVELEALNWLGMDYCSQWVGRIFDYNNMINEGGENEQEWMETI